MHKQINIYSYSNAARIFPEMRQFLGSGSQENNFTHPYFNLTDNPVTADFFLFPFALDPLFRKLGPKACRIFLTHLPHYPNNEKKHIFFLFDDHNLPLGLPSVIYRFSHDRHLKEPNSITLPALINYGDKLFQTPEKLAYHISFTGALSTHFCRLQMIMPFLKESEQPEFKKVLHDLTTLQNYRSTPKQYKVQIEKIKLKVAKFFPRTVTNRKLKYFLDISVDKFHLLPRREQQRLFTWQQEILKNSLMVLAPRGHGSYSIRFFEILAAGRIPILISDNYIPPLYWLIDYDDFIFRIPQNRALNTRQIMAEIFQTHNLPEFSRRCFKTRKIWETFFSPASFSAFLHLTLNRVRETDYNLNQTGLMK